MNRKDIQHAHGFYQALTKTGRDLARKELAGHLRVLGLQATFEWLASKNTETKGGPEVAKMLASELNLNPKNPSADLENRSNVQVFALVREAHRLVEALHLVSRAEEKGNA